MRKLISFIVALALFSSNAFAKEMCFSRVYDKDHLRKHIHQTVTAISFKMEPGEIDGNKKTNETYYNLTVKVRGTQYTRQVYGVCTNSVGNAGYCVEAYIVDDGHLRVLSEDDVGSFSIYPFKDHIMLYLKEPYAAGRVRLWLEESGFEESTFLEAGQDDTEFKLYPTHCN